MAFEIFENFVLGRRLRAQQLRSEIAQMEFMNKTFADAQRFVQPEPDEKMWMKTSDGGQLMDFNGDNYDHYEMLASAFKFWVTNLHARAVVRNLTKFVLGKGPVINPVSENKVVREAWDGFVKANKWSRREKEMVSRTFRDGEVFLRFFTDTGNGQVKTRFLRANNIRNPRDERETNKDESVSFGVGTNPDDVEDVRTYYLCDVEGKLIEKIPDAEVIHLKILTDSDIKRGMSILLVALPMIRKYAEWLDDRVVLNKVRSAIALVRKVPGTAATVGAVRDNNQSERFSADRFKQKGFNRGTVITASRGIEYDMLSPNIQAADAKDDGRSMLLAVAAGMGFPEMILTADYSNSNYASSLTAQNPFVREIEDWQDFFEDSYREIFRKVVAAGKAHGNIPDGESEECEIEWPPMILADIEKNNKAREIQHRNKIISKRTWQMKEDLDPATEEANMMDEQSKDVYKQPFNMPLSPINQLGAYGEFEEE